MMLLKEPITKKKVQHRPLVAIFDYYSININYMLSRFYFIFLLVNYVSAIETLINTLKLNYG